MFPKRKQWCSRCGKVHQDQGETLRYVFLVTRVHRSSYLGCNQYREGGGSQDDLTLRCGELKRLPKCKELTTSSFRGQMREAQGNVKRNRQGKQGGVGQRYPRDCRRRRGWGCRSGCQVSLHLEDATNKIDKVGGEDKEGDYQGGIDDNEDSKSDGIQVGADLVECTSGQSEDYPTHWGIYTVY